MTPEKKRLLTLVLPSALFSLAAIGGYFYLYETGKLDEVINDEESTQTTTETPSTDRSNPNLLSVLQFGSENDDTPHAIAVDASGIYIAGDTEGDLDDTNAAGPAAVATPNTADSRNAGQFGLDGPHDAFLEKYSLDGSRKLWGVQFGTNAYDAIRGLAVNSQGVYVAGTTEGSLDADFQGFSDVFLRKYNASGRLIWAKQFGTPQVDEAIWVVSDSERVCLGGGTVGRLGDQPKVGDEDIFARCYNHDGGELWTLQFGTEKFEETLGATLNDSGLYVVGATGGQIGDDPKIGGTDAWVGKISLDGDLVFTQQFGSKAVDFGHGISVNESTLYAIGRTEGKIPGERSAGGTDGFIQALSLDGATSKWVDQFGTAGGDSGHDILAHQTGVYAIGTMNGKSDKHGEETNLEDGYLRHYSPTGKFLWEGELATPAYDEPRAITVHENTLYVTGRTGGQFTGGTQIGAWDIFLARYEL